MAAQAEPKPVFDRTPPQNIEAERSVLGAMLLNSEAVGACIEVLRDDSEDVFYVEAHRQIYAAMVALFRKTRPVDEVTLLDQLRQDGHLESCGGASYLMGLTGAVPTSANADHYAQIVLDAAILRKLISTCTQIAGEAYEAEGDVREILDHAEADMFAIAETREVHPVYRIGDLVKAGVDQIDKLVKAHSGITGLASGFPKLDEMTSGFQPSDMIVLAARPSVGKTALALNIAMHAALQENKGILIFSLEMSREQLTQRLLCMAGRIDSRRLRSGFLARDEMRKVIPAADRLHSASIYIDDTPNISMLEIRSKTRRLASKHPVHLVIIDYLQLMNSPSRSRRPESRQVEISEISRATKGLARELRIPVLALSQLSREAEKDDVGIPKLSHLRESGAIEQDADVVLMLARPPKHEAEENENLIKLILAKQRNGPTGAIDMFFFKDVQRFEGIAGQAADTPQPARKGVPDEPVGDGFFDPEDNPL